MHRRNLGCYSEAKSGIIQNARSWVFWFVFLARPSRQAYAYFPSFLCGIINLGLIPWQDQPFPASDDLLNQSYIFFQ